MYFSRAAHPAVNNDTGRLPSINTFFTSHSPGDAVHPPSICDLFLPDYSRQEYDRRQKDETNRANRQPADQQTALCTFNNTGHMYL